MSTTVLKRRLSPANSNTSLIRLERSYATLVQLREKLTSYWLEPTTFSMHEAKEAFLNSIDMLLKTHLDLIHAIRNSKDTSEMQIAAVEEQLLNVKDIEERIKEYIITKTSFKEEIL